VMVSPAPGIMVRFHLPWRQGWVDWPLDTTVERFDYSKAPYAKTVSFISMTSSFRILEL
jgi:hypothetical protein